MVDTCAAGACSPCCMRDSRDTSSGRPGVGEYCSASRTSAAVACSRWPPATSREMPVKGKSDGLGIPPPREIMPGRETSGCSARIGDG